MPIARCRSAPNIAEITYLNKLVQSKQPCAVLCDVPGQRRLAITLDGSLLMVFVDTAPKQSAIRVAMQANIHLRQEGGRIVFHFLHVLFFLLGFGNASGCARIMSRTAMVDGSGTERSSGGDHAV